MKKSRFTEEQIVAILRETDRTPVAEVARKHKVSDQAIYTWRKRFGAKGYGAVLGLIATPILIVNAASPTIFAWIVDPWGWRSALLTLGASSSAAWIAIEFMSRWNASHRRTA